MGRDAEIPSVPIFFFLLKSNFFNLNTFKAKKKKNPQLRVSVPKSFTQERRGGWAWNRRRRWWSRASLLQPACWCPDSSRQTSPLQCTRPHTPALADTAPTPPTPIRGLVRPRVPRPGKFGCRAPQPPDARTSASALLSRSPPTPSLLKVSLAEGDGS